MNDTGTFITVMTPRCVVCKEVTYVSLVREKYEAWQGGAFIQDAFSDLSVSDREMLISGTHPACWDRLFPAGSEWE